MRCFASDTTLNMSPAYLRPGAPFGGRCLAKDLSALRAEARLRHVDVPLLDAAVPSNEAQFARALRLIGAEACGGIGIIGATFKPGVDDTDTSVYARLGLALADRGHEVRFHDRHLAVAKSADTPVAHPRLCLVDSLGALLEFAQTLVLCHADEAYLALLRKAALPSQRLVDLTGAGALACGAATYVSIAG
jgi:GDP-mannose 6-dehydrogenase